MTPASARACVLDWARILTAKALARQIGYSEQGLHAAIRHETIPQRILDHVATLGPIPTRIQCRRCDRGQTIPVSSIPPHGTPPGCVLCQQEKEQRYMERRYRFSLKRNPNAPFPTRRGALATAPGAPPCPECGTARKAQGKLLYCPRRCEAGLVLQRAS